MSTPPLVLAVAFGTLGFILGVCSCALGLAHRFFYFEEKARAEAFIAGRRAERDARAYADSEQARLYRGVALRLVRLEDA